MDFQRFLVTIEDHIAHVRINRPEKANALDATAWIELKQVFETLDRTPDVRVIVLSGEGKRFCAGADQSFLTQGVLKANDESTGHAREVLYQDILDLQAQVSAAEKCRKPVLAAIHNACVGGAVDIVTACDMCYATEDAFFAIAEIDLGIVADLGTMQRLPKILPKGVVREMAYTGRRMGAAEAKERGLVNEVYADKEMMMAGVMEIARTIASKSPLAIRGSKITLNHTQDHSIEEGLRHIAGWNAGMLFNHDLMEAFTAMMEKRKANFRD
ncbi:MAG: crotonase/enoyl-CoA hydratase family protein [Chloroflexota bacterium]